MNQANAEIVQVDESDETKMSTQKQVMENVAQEIENQIPDAKAIPYVMSYADGHASKTEGIVHIIRGNINSAVRVRPAKRIMLEYKSHMVEQVLYGMKATLKKLEMFMVQTTRMSGLV